MTSIAKHERAVADLADFSALICRSATSLAAEIQPLPRRLEALLERTEQVLPDPAQRRAWLAEHLVDHAGGGLAHALEQLAAVVAAFAVIERRITGGSQ
jgi:hypothetical protein